MLELAGGPPARMLEHELRDGEGEVDVLLGERNNGDRGLTFRYSGMKNQSTCSGMGSMTRGCGSSRRSSHGWVA